MYIVALGNFYIHEIEYSMDIDGNISFYNVIIERHINDAQLFNKEIADEVAEHCGGYVLKK